MSLNNIIKNDHEAIGTFKEVTSPTSFWVTNINLLISPENMYHRLIYTTPTDHQDDYEAILFGKLFGSLVASQLLGVANTYRSDMGCHLVKDINVFKKLVYSGVISKDRVPDIKSFQALVANDKMEDYAYALEDGCLEDTIHYFRKRLARLEELLKEAEQ